MHTYRIYHLDRDGRIVVRRTFRAPGDEAALEQLSQAADGRAVELWNGGRLVRRMEAGSNP